MHHGEPMPIVDFGGSGSSFHFAHANAYPPQCYRQYLEPLAAHFHVWAMEQRPLWPDQDPAQLSEWRLFATDLIRLLDQAGQSGVIGAGHSLGAVVSMMAAQERPDLFRALVLIEPVLLPPALLQAARDFPEEATRIPLVQRTRNRRRRWPNRQKAFDHFREKAIFERLAGEALWDYVNYGLKETGLGGVTLRYPREWEAQIYSRPPLDIWDDLPQINVPTLAIRGEHSDTISPDSWQRWQVLQPAAEFVEIADAGHLAPLEKPVELGEVTLDFLSRLDFRLWMNGG